MFETRLGREPPLRLRPPPALLPLHKRARESWIGLRTGTFALDESEGGVIAHGVVADEVRDDDAGRARDALS
jgi:hypothetical protein